MWGVFMSELVGSERSELSNDELRVIKLTAEKHSLFAEIERLKTEVDNKIIELEKTKKSCSDTERNLRFCNEARTECRIRYEVLQEMYEEIVKEILKGSRRD